MLMIEKYADIGLGLKTLRKFSGRDDPAQTTVVTEEITVTKKKDYSGRRLLEEVVKQRKKKEGLIKESGKKSTQVPQIWAGRALMARN